MRRPLPAARLLATLAGLACAAAQAASEPASFFPWAPPDDAFTADALLDLRGLNEAVAGEHGFVRREGDSLVRGDGEPLRFWGVHVGNHARSASPAEARYAARRLAKVGVNLARVSVREDFPFDDPARMEPAALDKLFSSFAALREQGIYTLLSLHFPLRARAREGWGLEGYVAGQASFGLLFFDRRMQEIYRERARVVLNTRNPYTGLTLAEDPALAMVEIVNEDSLFFPTTSPRTLPAVQWKKLEGRFGAWLAGRHQSLAAALSGFDRAPGDDAAGGRAALAPASELSREGMAAASAGRRSRLRAQARFFTALQHGFYTETVRFFREDLGCRSLFSASNWKTADAALTDALERYSYTAAEVLDRHGYFGGKHDGQGAGWSVRVGHHYESRAAVRHPERLPIQYLQVEGRPMAISEIGWTQPNRFRAGFAFLSATYGALQGLDVNVTFALAKGDDWSRWARSIEKFHAVTPAVLGSFPAAALLFRRGDVGEGPVVVRDRVALESVYRLEGEGGYAAPAVERMRAWSGSRREPTRRFDPLAFYVGRVVRRFDAEGEAPLSPLTDPGPYIDRAAGRVSSATGALAWDFRRGLVRVDTPRAQGALGFLAESGAQRFGDVTLEVANEYASVLVVSLDGRPLASSARILVQTVTEDRLSGFRSTRPGGGEILALGGPPLEVRRVEASLRMRTGAFTVQALGPHGYARGGPVPVAAGTRFTLAPDALYHVLVRVGSERDADAPGSGEQPARAADQQDR